MRKNMEYKKFENTYVVRLDPGDEIVESIKKISLKENIKLAMVNGLGGINNFEVGVYDVKEKQYHRKEFNGAYEITSLHGNINTMNGEFYTHIHMSACGIDYNAVGGHLYKAVISATAEIFITVLDGIVDREKNQITGLNTFKF